MIITVIAVFVGLFMFENLPTSLVAGGLVAQVGHLALLSSFPFFSATSPSFLLSVVMVVLNHYLAFSFFGENFYPFSEVMAYFTVCMWLVPFSFFVSLSANENVLPTLNQRRMMSSVIISVRSRKDTGFCRCSTQSKIRSLR